MRGSMRGPWLRRLILAVAASTGLGASLPAIAAPDSAASVLGRWLTRDADGVFDIRHCGDALCGQLVGMRYSGAMPTDSEHRPQCGLTLLEGFVPADEPGRWHGTIRDPDDGNRYQATIWSPEPGILKLRGYLLLPLLGETQQWTRYSGPIGAACKLP
ncbi:DUF2147 domain-containing protein [Acetobacteraceae bacterium KSS8]|uniref:DUF2147 domain-containing protein n=1 Tax=Endosaccharibacter trunci TaxID=2812733 RepID=A0ABT1W4N7_9PROT|nr:DUF2147 domain-containing protein [Acetobacteraceae bacterium KSS8]